MNPTPENEIRQESHILNTGYSLISNDYPKGNHMTPDNPVESQDHLLAVYAETGTIAAC
jgi:hypothetical protein